MWVEGTHWGILPFINMARYINSSNQTRFFKTIFLKKYYILLLHTYIHTPACRQSIHSKSQANFMDTLLALHNNN